MVLFERVEHIELLGQVLKDCNYWYYLNELTMEEMWKDVLKDCNYWYYLNANVCITSII